MQLQPELMKLHGFDVETECAKGMKVALSDPRPVDELDAQFESRVRLPNEVIFIDAEHGVESDDRWNRGFAYANDADLFRLDELDAHLFAESARKSSCSHPSGSAASDDQDLLNARCIHVYLAQWCLMIVECEGIACAA